MQIKKFFFFLPNHIVLGVLSDYIGVAKSNFETSFPVSVTPDPKLDNRGSMIPDPKQKILLLRNDIVLGVLSD